MKEMLSTISCEEMTIATTARELERSSVVRYLCCTDFSIRACISELNITNGTSLPMPTTPTQREAGTRDRSLSFQARGPNSVRPCLKGTVRVEDSRWPWSCHRHTTSYSIPTPTFEYTMHLHTGTCTRLTNCKQIFRGPSYNETEYSNTCL